MKYFTSESFLRKIGLPMISPLSPILHFFFCDHLSRIYERNSAQLRQTNMRQGIPNHSKDVCIGHWLSTTDKETIIASWKGVQNVFQGKKQLCFGMPNTFKSNHLNRMARSETRQLLRSRPLAMQIHLCMHALTGVDKGMLIILGFLTINLGGI